MNFSDMKIATRLGTGFAVVMVLLMVVTGLGINRMAMLKARMDDVVKVNDKKRELATKMRVTIYERANAVRNLALLREDAGKQFEANHIIEQGRIYTELESRLLKVMADDPDITAEEKAIMEKIRQTEQVALPVLNQIRELAAGDHVEQLTQILLKDYRPKQRRWLDDTSTLIELESKLNDTDVATAEATYLNGSRLMIALGILAVVAGSAIAWQISRSITHPIAIAVKIAQTVAAGDLTSQIRVNSRDETGQLLQSLKDMSQSLQQVVTRVHIAADTIASASTQIASGNLDLSNRTEQQAGSLEETASSMEELTSTVRQNTGHAQQASELSAAACGIAGQGGSVVTQVVATMGAINESSRKIVDIISVIDGIAFQTNILALNAAVEAARAGEQGRGFAVVAGEVRNLAQRSAAAAREIKTLINDSVEKVDEGAKLVDQAGQTMDQVVGSVQKVARFVADISVASGEQISGIEQVNAAIIQMDQTTQENAALVEEAAAAAAALKEQVAKLTQAVSIFRLA